MNYTLSTGPLLYWILFVGRFKQASMTDEGNECSILSTNYISTNLQPCSKSILQASIALCTLILSECLLSQARDIGVACIARNQVKRLEELVGKVETGDCKAFTNDFKDTGRDEGDIQRDTGKIGNPFLRVSPPEDFPVQLVDELVEVDGLEIDDFSHNAVGGGPETLEEGVYGGTVTGSSIDQARDIRGGLSSLGHSRGGWAGHIGGRGGLANGRGSQAEQSQGKESHREENGRIS